MATVTLPVLALRDGKLESLPTDFEIDKLSFTRSITRQGKGARAAWRHHFRTLPKIPQSHAVLGWNVRRRQHYANPFGAPIWLHGIRETYRRDVLDPELARAELERTEKALRSDPWAMIDKPSPALLHGDEQAAPGSDDR